MDINVIASCLNFAVVLAILAYFGRQPAKDFFKTRSEVLSKSVREAEAIAQAAIRAKAEMEQKLASAKSEMVARQREAEESMKKLKQSALAKASQEAERIHRDSQLLQEGEQVRARKQLLKELGDDSVAAVRRYLSTSLEDKDKDALVTDYLTRVTAGHAG
jgi:F-type H+-transporting ATPase subunit b